MSNSLDHDQARRIVGPDQGPNCLPRLSADDTGRQRVNVRARDKFPPVTAPGGGLSFWRFTSKLHVQIQMFENNGYVHIYSPWAGTDDP